MLKTSKTELGTVFSTSFPVTFSTVSDDEEVDVDVFVSVLGVFC